ncbi:MAG TPA: class I SAM-dependent methyltransferase [Kiritimatiellia bacterium]|nr:class I SAM-dependent methyltransferase [Kiritimatiellia bacterium]
MSIISRLRTTASVLTHGLPEIQRLGFKVEVAGRSRYEHMLHLFRQYNPRSMIEIGVWRGDRTIRFLSDGEALKRYVGFDLFEGMTNEKYQYESMGQCVPHSKEAVMKRIRPIAVQRGCSVDLISGKTEETLPGFAKEYAGQYDFIYIDGGHSLETVANDWEFSKRLLAPHGLVIFDDYYLNDDSRGAKPLVDMLLHDRNYRVRFFPMTEDIIEDIQITMVAVSPQQS